MKPPVLQRREALVLAGLLGAAGLTLAAVRHFQPLGQPLSRTPVVEAALAEPGPEAGNPEGDVPLIVFTDFNCGACRTAHAPMLEAVARDGMARLRFLDWPIFGDDSRAAARAAIAADAQAHYLAVHSALMQGGRADGRAAEAALAAAGGNVDDLRATLAASGARIDRALQRNASHAFALGLGGTPGHLIGTTPIRGALSRREFSRAIEQARSAG